MDKCRGCDATFEQTPGSGRKRQWCSNNCRSRTIRYEDKPPNPKRPCSGCGVLIRAWATTIDPYCRECRRHGVNYQPVWRPDLLECPTCRRMFEPRRADQIYCMYECRPRRWGKRAPHILSSSARGYGADHVRRRREVAVVVDAGEADCCLCGDPIDPGSPWHLDHTPDRTDYRGPAHASCNLRDGAVRRNQARRPGGTSAA